MSKRHRWHRQMPNVSAAPEHMLVSARVSWPLWRSLILFGILLSAALALWRLVLLKPLLALSRDVVDISFSLLVGVSSAGYVTVDSGGDWIVHDPLRFPEPRIAVALEGLQCFSMCLPIFWALALAARPGQRLWRVLGLGTLLLVVVSQLSLVLFLVYDANPSFGMVSAPWAVFLLHVAGYCTLNVVPYAAPLMMVMWLDRNLRAQVFPEPTPQIQPGPRAS